MSRPPPTHVSSLAAPKPAKPILLQRGIDFLFGYDFFISYAWADARHYATLLAKKLREQGFECFLDSSDFIKGENWRFAGRRALRKTSRLLVLVSPKALESEPVREEVESYSRTGRMIIPIDFDGTLTRAKRDSAMAPLLPTDVLHIAEDIGALQSGPSEKVLAEIRDSFQLMRQNQKRVRWFAAAAGAFALIAVAAVAGAAIAEARRKEALSRSLASQAIVVADHELDLALLLAARAHAIRPTTQSRASLLELLHRAPVERYFYHGSSSFSRLAAHPRRLEIVASATSGGEVALWDVQQHARLASASAGATNLFALAFNQAGSLLCSAGMDGQIAVWEVSEDPSALRLARTLPHPAAKIIRVLHFLDDDKLLVGADEAALRCCDVRSATWAELPRVHTAPISAIVRDPSGRFLITGASDSCQVQWDLADPTFERHTTVRGTDWPLALAISPDGRLLAAGTHDKGVELWNYPDRKLIGHLPAGHRGGRIFAVAFSPKGQELVWGGDDGAINVQPTNKDAARRYPAHSDALLDLTYTRGGEQLVTAGRDRKLAVLAPGRLSPLIRELARFTNTAGWITAAALSRETQTFALGDEKGNLSLLDAVVGGLPVSMTPAHAGRVTSILWMSKDELVSAGADGLAIRWRRESGKLVQTQRSQPMVARGLRLFSRSGELFAVTDKGAVYRVGPNGTLVSLGLCSDSVPSEQPPMSFATHPCRPLVAAGNRAELWFFDYERNQRRRVATGADFIRVLSFTPAGDELICAVASRLEIRSAANGALRATLQVSRVLPADCALSDDGLLVASDTENHLTWWDLPSRSQLGSGLQLPTLDLAALCFSSQGGKVFSLERSYADGWNQYTLRAWEAHAQVWAETASRIAARELSAVEAQRFGL